MVINFFTPSCFSVNVRWVQIVNTLHQTAPRFPSTLKKLDEEGADGVPALAAVVLRWVHVVHHSVLIKPSPLLQPLLLLFLLLLLLLPPLRLASVWALAGRRSFLLPSLPLLLSAALGELHVGLGRSLLAGFGLQDFLSFAGVLPLLQLPHQLLPVLAGFHPVGLAEVRFAGVATPVPGEGNSNNEEGWESKKSRIKREESQEKWRHNDCNTAVRIRSSLEGFLSLFIRPVLQKAEPSADFRAVSSSLTSPGLPVFQCCSSPAGSPGLRRTSARCSDGPPWCSALQSRAPSGFWVSWPVGATAAAAGVCRVWPDPAVASPHRGRGGRGGGGGRNCTAGRSWWLRKEKVDILASFSFPTRWSVQTLLHLLFFPFHTNKQLQNKPEQQGNATISQEKSF